MVQRIDVTAAVLTRNGTVMLARRAMGEHLEQHWEFPGGKIDPGETPETCLERELFEEFRIKARIGDFITVSEFDYPDKHIRLLAYRADLLDGDPELTVHDAIVWVPTDQLLTYDLAKADILIAEVLIATHQPSLKRDIL